MKVAITPAAAPDTAHMALWTKSLILADGYRAGALEIAERLKAPAAVIKVLQAPMSTYDTDMDAFANSNTILTSFAATSRNISAFFWILANGAFRAPFNQRVSYLTGIPEGRMVDEAQVIGVKRSAGDKVFLQPRKVAGISVFSQELVQSAAGSGEAFLTNELRRAILPTLDSGFLSLITDGNTPTTASAGISAAGAVADLRWLLEQVSPKAESRLVWVAAPDVGRGLATMYDGGFVFPEMSPTGGTVLNLPAIVSDGMEAGTLGLLDATGIAAETMGVELSVSRQSSIQLDDAPDSPATAATAVISLWQNNLVGVMPSIIFGAERMKDNAFAKITGIGWDNPDSPA